MHLIFRYDPDCDIWTNVDPMKTKRIGVGVASLNRLLYAVGGYDGSNRLRSAECYDPEVNEWSPIPPMNTTRSGAGNLHKNKKNCNSRLHTMH